jgi:Flp pilus assembly protein TadG
MRYGRRFGASEKGSALIEFAALLPFFLIVLVEMVDLCLLLDQQLSLIHLSREAASASSRGSSFTQTLKAITQADGNLSLDGAGGKIILTSVSLDGQGRPVITAQQSIGGLSRSSVVGTMSGSGTRATIPNGRSMRTNSSLVVVELFSQQQHFLGNTKLYPGQGGIVLHTLAAF